MKFLKNEKLNDIVENTDLYLVQKCGKSVNTDSAEMKIFLGLHISMWIVQMPRYDAYWSLELRYPLLADAMPLKRYKQLRRFLHVADNDALPDRETNKLAKIWPMIEATRSQWVKVEPKKYHSVDEQIVPSKTISTSVVKKRKTLILISKVCKKALLLLQSFAKICLIIVNTKCFLTIGSLPFLCFTSLRKWRF